jgi:hypothetical protein
MTIRQPQRVLVGLGADHEMRHVIEAAVNFAAAAKSGLLCLIVQQQSLLNYAGLPFAKAYGPGGFASTLTVQIIESHFNHLARSAEKVLTESCARTSVNWQMTRPQGETLQELSLVLEHGDIVVINLRDILESGKGLLGAARLFLDTAVAVVVPARAALPGNPVIAVGNGPGTEQAAAIAGGIGQATGAKVEVVDASGLLHLQYRASAVVAPLGIVETMGEAEFLRQIARTGAAAVLVSE